MLEKYLEYLFWIWVVPTGLSVFVCMRVIMEAKEDAPKAHFIFFIYWVFCSLFWPLIPIWVYLILPKIRKKKQDEYWGLIEIFHTLMTTKEEKERNAKFQTYNS
ncbi:hypothetical protein AB3N61_09340 [Leptospira sp. WS58.C1]|uniref:hypothetical protein n=1 Tax=Leptospira cinconiae TaxID=3235173 RepID=UPI00349EE58F